MKKIIFTTLLFSFFLSKISAQAVIADPAVNLMRTATVTAIPVDPLLIPIDSIIELKVPVINYNQLNALPSGSCKIKIGLGSKMILNPGFDLTTVNTSNYFQWTAEMSGGQMQITGDLVANLPGNYADTVTFRVKGSTLGNSTVTTNFLVTNHNTTVNLSDENGTNNNASLAYTIIEGTGGPLPVTFTKFNVLKEACNVKVDFYTENEINVNRFEIEVSKNGIDYEKLGTLAAANASHYQFLFDITSTLSSKHLFVRIRSVDIDGQYQYSNVNRIAGTCAENDKAIIVFPNPAPSQNSYFTISTEGSLFNGAYIISIMDMSGKLVRKTSLNINNLSRFKYEYGNLPAAQYIISLQKENEKPIVFSWQKR